MNPRLVSHETGEMEKSTHVEEKKKLLNNTKMLLSSQDVEKC